MRQRPPQQKKENCGFTKPVENWEFVKPWMLERSAGATYSITRAGAAWTSVSEGVTAGVGVTMGIGGSRKFAMSSRCSRGCHKLNHGCRSGRDTSRGKNLVVGLLGSVCDGNCRSNDEWRQPPPFVPPVARASKKHEVSCYVSAMRTIQQHGRRVQHQPWMSPVWVLAKRSENKRL